MKIAATTKRGTQNLILVACLFAMIAAALSFRLSETPFSNSDDALFAKIAATVVEGKLYPPHAGAYPYHTEPPPLFFWWTGAANWVFGELGLRGAILFAALFTLIMLLLMAREFKLNLLIGFTIVLLLATSEHYFRLSRRFLTDIPGVAGLTTFLYFWIKHKWNRGDALIAATALAVVFLHKRALLIFPFLGLLTFLCAEKFSKASLKRIGQLALPFLGLMLAWHLIEVVVLGDSWYDAVANTIFQAVGSSVAGWTGGPLFYLEFLIKRDPLLLVVGVVSLFYLLIRRESSSKRALSTLLGWILGGLLVLSLVHTKNGRYALALYPVLALVVGLAISQVRLKWIAPLLSLVALTVFAIKYERISHTHVSPYAHRGLKQTIERVNQLTLPNDTVHLFEIYFAQALFYGTATYQEIALNPVLYKSLNTNWFIRNNDIVKSSDFLGFRQAARVGDIHFLIMRTDDYLKFGRGLPLNIDSIHSGFLLLTRKPERFHLKEKNWTIESYLHNSVDLLTQKSYKASLAEIESLEKKVGRNLPITCPLKAIATSLDKQQPTDFSACQKPLDNQAAAFLQGLAAELERHAFVEIARPIRQHLNTSS